MAKTQRSTGTVKWFSAQKGFGFIAPDEGGEDLFVHQTAIRSEGFRTLSEGQPVVFAVDFGDNGRSKAIEVEAVSRSHRRGIRSGRDGGVFGGRGRGGAYGRDGRGGRSGGHGSCFNCGRMGHLARDCYSGSAGGGGGGGGRGYGGGRGGGRRGGSRGCYNCGEEGHFARDCPHREQKREMMKEK